MIDDEEDADYEEEEEDDEDEEDEEVEEDFVDEEQGAELVDMGSFSEPGRKFLSKVWKEYEPIRVDGIVTAAECKHCARNICAERKHGTSSLRKHLKRCKERRKALRVAGQLNASIMSPDGVALGPWTFNQAVSRKELMRMIVLHELPFSLVEYEGFRRFVSSLNPSFKMICRTTVRNDCLKEFAEEKRYLQGLLKNTNSKVSLTSDMWTSNRMVGYIVITAHYIDEKWQQQKRIVKFIAMETPHTGIALFNTMIKFIREWGIEDKLFAVTLDNANNNGAMMKLLKTHLLTKKMLLSSGRLFHQRCAAHVINLICQAGLEFLSPMIEKIRDTVKYIRSSPTRKEKFEEIVAQLGILCGKRPCLDVCTRWNSTYLMLSTAKEFRAVFDSLHIQDPNYTFRPTYEEWEKADAICRLLKVFYEATNVISGTKYPTSNLYLHEMLKVKLTLEQQPFEEGSEMHPTLKYMKKKFEKYWKVSWLDICIPVILDPQFKLEYLEFRFRTVFENDATWMVNKIKNVFQGLFKEYLKSNGNVADPMSQGGDVEMSVIDPDPLASWDQHVTRTTNEASLELETYLKKVPIHRSDQFNILAWWQMNSAEYPTLSRMARDILAVPASTIAFESAFSTGSRIISDFRS
jgi:hypothetical protein